MNRERRNFIIYSFILSFLFLTICTKSSFLYPFNDWYDANDFLTLGRGILNGLVPYRDLYEQKGPVLYFLHALCALIPGKEFFGVFLLEVLSLSIFLYYASKIIRIYVNGRYAYFILPVLCACLLSSESFCHGDSAEELCAPFIMIALYYTLSYLDSRYPKAPSVKMLLINGFFAGMIFWIKYTLLGFHFMFMAALFFICIAHKHYKKAFTGCLFFISGMLLPAIPVFIYYGYHHAFSDLLTVYFYNNMFLYDPAKASGLITLCSTILLRIGDTFLRNIQFSIFTLIGVPVFLFSKRLISSKAGKLMLLSEAVGLAVFIYTGSNFPYYGYILCVFCVLGLTAIAHFISVLSKNGHSFINRHTHIYEASTEQTQFGFWFPPVFLCILCLVFAYYKSPNTAMIGIPKEDLVQFQFAEIMHESDHPTLLNYGFLDAGFYTAADILPSEKYFQMQNISYESFPEMMDEQDACIREQRVDYVIVRSEEVPSFILDYYTPIKEQRQLYEGSHVNYILLKKK